MATVNERLAESLRVLKKYQEKNDYAVIHGKDTLGTTHTNRLLNSGYLQQIIKGWYMPSLPGNEGDTTVWYTSYWHFIAAYANNRFGNDWSLSAEQSLAFYSGYYVVPKQDVIRAKQSWQQYHSVKIWRHAFRRNSHITTPDSKGTTIWIKLLFHCY